MLTKNLDARVKDPSLLTRTRALLGNRPYKMTLPLIAAETGLSIHWLRQIANGNVKSPNVHDVQCLYEYLVGQPLFAADE